MKNRITLTNRILPVGRIVYMAATLALLIATGAPALATRAPTSHAIAVSAPTPQEIGRVNHARSVPLWIKVMLWTLPKALPF